VRIFENRVLRRIYGPERNEKIGSCRKLYTEELHNLYPSLIIGMIKPRRMKWSRSVACMEKKWHAYSVLVGKPQENEPLGRSRHRWEDNIQMCLREIRWGALDWIHLSWDRNQWWTFMNMVMNLWVP
jgi:hypothetical protein